MGYDYRKRHKKIVKKPIEFLPRKLIMCKHELDKAGQTCYKCGISIFENDYWKTNIK